MTGKCPKCGNDNFSISGLDDLCPDCFDESQDVMKKFKTALPKKVTKLPEVKKKPVRKFLD